jgi:hypothetical protein
MRRMIFPAIFLMILVIGSCSPSPTAMPQEELPVAETTMEATPGPTATIAFDVNSIACVFATLQPATVKGELFNNAGTESQTATLAVAADTTIRIYWEQNAGKSFELAIVRADTAATGETGNKQTIETYLGPSSGCSDTKLPKGEYQVVVTTSGGAWNVVIQEIETNN